MKSDPSKKSSGPILKHSSNSGSNEKEDKQSPKADSLMSFNPKEYATSNNKEQE